MGDLGFDRGAHLLVRRALAAVAPGEFVDVRSNRSDTDIHLRAWCRRHGHEFVAPGRVVRGTAADAAFRTATRAGDAAHPADHADASWGLAARGALVEPGGPEPPFRWSDKATVWSDDAAKLYAQAAAAQWDPRTAIDWDGAPASDPAVEQAVVDVMTYLVENEQAALVVPARFLGHIHPHFREVLQVLAVQVADEARHIDVFVRRARLSGAELGLSSVGGRASLTTLLDEPDFATASFLLSVLGEGTFLSLLSFLEKHAPDAVTAQVTRLACQDEARHVAFGVSHLAGHVAREPQLRGRLAAAVERRHDALTQTAGLNDTVFDALVLLAAGSFTPDAIGRGYDAVQSLQADMDAGRRRRLARLGFSSGEAETLSSLHTRNFM